MKSKLFLLIIISSFLFNRSFGQEGMGCFMNTANLQNPPLMQTLTTNCGIPSDYSPLNSGQSPIIKVRIDFVVFQKDDGTGNFQNNSTDKAYLHNVVNNVNYRLSHLSNLTYGTSPWIKDSRIRVKLDTIYFYKNTNAQNGPSNGEYPFYKQYVKNNSNLSNEEKVNVEHIFII